MRVTRHADYALRVLIYVGGNPERAVTIAEIAERYRISRSHLMKVVNRLVREGFLIGQRGKGGGLYLAMPAETIRVGKVLRLMQSEQFLVECMASPQTCLVDRGCRLRAALGEALEAFYEVLDRYTLRDLLDNPATLNIVRLVPSQTY
ncbi:MAG TPA: Rrf2 family transcriptional regulator [Burkholderiaceae bacterium]|nr:Rrf2 family transcriptional regulator [Burkholderiaceae bacterium]